jgi:hypothetical protein
MNFGFRIADFGWVVMGDGESFLRQIISDCGYVISDLMAMNDN